MPDASTPHPPLFSEACCQLVFVCHGPRGGGTPKLTAWQWIMARVYHELARQSLPDCCLISEAQAEKLSADS